MSTAAGSRAARQEETRAALVDTAERLFTENGYHATSLDAIAREAGFTKGAVYANFSAKEDLFLEVYARRAERFVAHTEGRMAAIGAAEALHEAARFTTTREGRDDGWIAVFFEFWAHVLRNPELRERFAALRARTREPMRAALATALGQSASADLDGAVAAMGALQNGLALERLTDPEVVSPTLGEQISRLAFEHLGAEK